MNRSKWNGTPEGERFERHTGMQDPSLVIWDEATLYKLANGHDAPESCRRGTELTESELQREIGQYVIDMDTLPDLTQHPDPRAALVLDALLRICCPDEAPPMPSSPPPAATEVPLSLPQTA